MYAVTLILLFSISVYDVFYASTIPEIYIILLQFHLRVIMHRGTPVYKIWSFRFASGSFVKARRDLLIFSCREHARRVMSKETFSIFSGTAENVCSLSHYFHFVLRSLFSFIPAEPLMCRFSS